MLQVEGARVRFDDFVALDDVDISVGSQETVAVLGPSGCGKTTLLRAIAGLQPLDDGRIAWDGSDLAAVPPHQRRFGLMFQEYALFPHRDVAGNVEFGLRMHGLDRDGRAARVQEVLDLVGLGDAGTRAVATLSGGEQQRVALARALAVEPRLLMLDEPLGALDRAWRSRLIEDIRALLDRAHLAALYVTHDHTEAFAIAHRVVVMRAGKVVQDAPPAEVWSRPADAWTAEFLGFGGATRVRVEAGEMETPWGRLPAPADAPTGAVDLVFRSDALALADDGLIGGTVTRVTFGGADVVASIAPATGPTLVVRVPQRLAPEVGASVRLSVARDALLCYPPD
jgi:thiamine transport system ATP-binding protein